MSVDRSSLEKLNKTQLVDYTLDVISKFNDQVNSYKILYEEYQKLINLNESLNSNKQDIHLESDQEIDSLKEKLSLAEKEILNLNEMIAKFHEVESKKSKEAKESENKEESTKINELLNKTISLTQENEHLKNEIVTLKAKGSNKLSDINSLEKCTKNPYSVQTYNINAFENRVDNTEIYGGRQFIIASILIKLDNTVFTWTVDFKGSELYAPSKVTRTLEISEENLESIKVSAKEKGMYQAIKNVFSIRDNFSPSFLQSPVMVAGNEVIIN